MYTRVETDFHSYRTWHIRRHSVSKLALLLFLPSKRRFLFAVEVLFGSCANTDSLPINILIPTRKYSSILSQLEFYDVCYTYQWITYPLLRNGSLFRPLRRWIIDFNILSRKINQYIVRIERISRWRTCIFFPRNSIYCSASI